MLKFFSETLFSELSVLESSKLSCLGCLGLLFEPLECLIELIDLTISLNHLGLPRHS